ncbi:zinc-binding dehydrogenase [Bradyrhizobium elkanii]|uniref:zinc-binding dehydrogenase n=1 Tax=Bradyrhizobium elkanii TaxID=29448 RepID=UPI00056EC323|nr:zinc-binding dehydrogenase [Bradyrhizobium elkanii]WLA87343.1 zinc-binding dehydrogenase [Bradyrhizobium elkanii]
MKAAILKKFGAPLIVEHVPMPAIGTGEVIVDVVAAPMVSYARDVFSGARNYPLPTPVIPGLGGIGRVREAGPDATHLNIGDWVFCDPTVRSRDDALMPDIALQGWSARGKGGAKLQTYHRDGTFAEQVRIPTECAIPIGHIDASNASRWSALSVLTIAYGGLVALDFRPGETLLVNGATGNFGSATVQVALAMGARCVVAVGRNETVLEDLRRRFGERLVPVRLSEDASTAAMQAATQNPIDAVLDFLPPHVPATVARAAVMSVRPYGRVVLMGGVGMLGGEDLALPYPWIMRNNITIRGQWMYEAKSVTTLIGLIRVGLLDLEQFEVAEFGIDRINEAVSHAFRHAGPFRLTVTTM